MKVNIALISASKLVITAGIVFAVSSCYSISENPDTGRKPDPYFTDRDFVKKGVEATGARVDEWVGRIAIWTGNEYIFYTRPYLPGGSPSTISFPSTYSYHTIIDKDWQFSGTFPFVSADASGKKATEVLMYDMAYVSVDPNDEPLRGDTFNQEARNRGIEDPSKVPLYWVKGAAIAVITKKEGAKVSSGGTVSAYGFGASGGAAYSASGSENVPLISILALPMNALADQQARMRTQEYLNNLKQQSTTSTDRTVAVLHNTLTVTSINNVNTENAPVSLIINRNTGLVPYHIAE